jgi:hypothetical protein
MSAPSPKPEEPKSDSWLRQFWQDHQAVATIIAALVALFVGIAFGRSSTYSLIPRRQVPP